MTKNEDAIKDWRSTGRRRARRELFRNYVEYKCNVCSRTSLSPPKDAPKWFDELWPEERRELNYPLQANHMTKDYTQNDIDVIEWLCEPCHKVKDSQTDKGESTVQREIPEPYQETLDT